MPLHLQLAPWSSFPNLFPFYDMVCRWLFLRWMLKLLGSPQFVDVFLVFLSISKWKSHFIRQLKRTPTMIRWEVVSTSTPPTPPLKILMNIEPKRLHYFPSRDLGWFEKPKTDLLHLSGGLNQLHYQVHRMVEESWFGIRVGGSLKQE